MISRRKFIQGAFVCGIGAISVGSYSRIFEPRWIEINNVTIKLRALPRRFEGMTIAQLSDIHHCKYAPREFVQKCIRKVNTLSPDVIALTGDYIYGSNSFLLPVTEELAKLKAKEGIFAVLGNHDIKDDVSDALRKAGINLLINEHVPLYRGKDYLFMAGVDDLWKGKMDLDRTLKGTDEKPKILLAHNPDAINEIKYTNVDFVMAGHTHGGQVYLPFVKPTVMFPKCDTPYMAGLFREGKTIMYVNKGIGVSGFPVRFFARPEITLFTLTSNRSCVV